MSCERCAWVEAAPSVFLDPPEELLSVDFAVITILWGSGYLCVDEHNNQYALFTVHTFVKALRA